MTFLLLLAPKFFYPLVSLSLLLLGFSWGILFYHWYSERLYLLVRGSTGSKLLSSLSSHSLLTLYLMILFLLFLFGIYLNINVFENFISSNWVKYLYLLPFLATVYHYSIQYLENDKTSFIYKNRKSKEIALIWFLFWCTLLILIPFFCILSLFKLLLEPMIFYFTFIFYIALWIIGIYIGVVIHSLFMKNFFSYKKLLLLINILIWGVIITSLFQKSILSFTQPLIWSIGSLSLLFVTYQVLNRYVEKRMKFLSLHLFLLFLAIITSASCIQLTPKKNKSISNKNKFTLTTPHFQREFIIRLNNTKKLENIYIKSKKENRHIFIYFSAKWCAPCADVRKELLPDKKFLSFLKKRNWIFVEIDLTKPGDFNDEISEQFNIEYMPMFVLIDKSKNELFRIEGYEEKKMTLKKLYINSTKIKK